MTNQFDVTRNSPEDRKAAAWVKPTLERLSLKEALSHGTKHTDGTAGGNTTFS
jgi:hypothetical protein